MSNIVVIYKSKYGATKQYAQWIAKELSCDLFDQKNAHAKALESCDTIIYGGGLYSGGVNGIELITKYFDAISNKNLIVFTCGLADPKDESNREQIKENLKKVLTPKMQEKIKLFHLRGGINYQKLGIIHTLMMSMLYRSLIKKDYDTLRNEDKELLATYGKIVDFTDESTIMPIIEYVQICEESLSMDSAQYVDTQL